MSATTTPSLWDKALPSLARFSMLPQCAEVAEYIRQWLVVLAVEPDRAGEFDAALDAYARDLRRAALLVGEQGSGFLLAVYARQLPHDETRAELVRQVDRRMAREGRRYCRWRGTIPASMFDDWRHDDAVRRARLPNKGERE